VAFSLCTCVSLSSLTNVLYRVTLCTTAVGGNEKGQGYSYEATSVRGTLLYVSDFNHLIAAIAQYMRIHCEHRILLLLAVCCADNRNKTYNSDTASNSNITSNSATNGGKTAAATPLGLNSTDVPQLDTNATDTINAAKYELKDADVQDFDSKSHKTL
jgi:hypothetical protein